MGEVHHVIRQTRTAEGQVVRQPQRVVLLSVVVVPVDGATYALIVSPGDVAHRVLAISHLIAIDHLPNTVHVTATADLVPRVVRQSVAVDILRHHHHPSLVHPTEHQVSHLLIRIAPYGEVALSRDIRDRVVEMERDIPAPAAERHDMSIRIRRTVPSQSFVTLLYHRLLRVALLVLRRVVDILSRCRPVLIDRLDILRVCHPLVHPLCTYRQSGGQGHSQQPRHHPHLIISHSLHSFFSFLRNTACAGISPVVTFQSKVPSARKWNSSPLDV